MIPSIYKSITLLDNDQLVSGQSTINIGTKLYTFIDSAPASNEIEIGIDNIATITNIKNRVVTDLLNTELQNILIIDNVVILIGLVNGSDFILSTNTPDAFILYSDIVSKYTVGNWWVNGLMKKSFFRTPSLKVLTKNVKRLILQQQSFIFNQINSDENTNLIPFRPDDIYLGLGEVSPNPHALYISARKSNSVTTGNSKTEDIIIKIASSTGPADSYTESYGLALQYLQAIQSIFESFDIRELILGWSGSITDMEMTNNSDNPQATIIIAELGAIPELLINIRVTAAKQKMNL